MIALELSCVAIVALYLIVRARQDAHPKRFIGRLALLMAAAWAGENSVIHAYHFYAYNPDWSLFVDQVPILIVTIWPVVIHSAWDLAKRLCTKPAHIPLAASAIVLADASLIEPIAVKSGLWVWFEPGIFEVPPVGIIGWALFAWLCFVVFERRRMNNGWALLVAPALVHPMLLILWWAALRWANGAVDAWPVVAVAWVVSCGLAGAALKVRAGARLPLSELLLRVPAAGFFFVLLALNARDEPALIAYALAFAPPYIVLTMQARKVLTSGV